MVLHNDEYLIIIDPSYENLQTFRQDFDYDLVGNAISLHASFIRNPIGYVHSIIEQHVIELALTSLICFGIFLVTICLLYIIKRMIHYIKLIKLFIKEFKSLRSQLKEIKKNNLPMNYDLYAKSIFTVLISYYELFKGKEKRIIPEDMIEFEIIRFVLEAAWKNTVSSRQLLVYTENLNRSTEDKSLKEPLEEDLNNVIDNRNVVMIDDENQNINNSRPPKKSYITDDNDNDRINKIDYRGINKQNLSNKSTVKPRYKGKYD
ncbi:unnamed protein product [Schistosoma turkestanicum]|nr:unnamed protein product [Schistosoma turkestanicum]